MNKNTRLCQWRRRGSAFRFESGDVNRMLMDYLSTIGGCCYLCGLPEFPARGLLILIEFASLFDGFIRPAPGPNAPDEVLGLSIWLGAGTDLFASNFSRPFGTCAYLYSCCKTFLSLMSTSTDLLFDL